MKGKENGGHRGGGDMKGKEKMGTWRGRGNEGEGEGEGTLEGEERGRRHEGGGEGERK